jgi:peptide-methionine (S)-S-oxide reductase
MSLFLKKTTLVTASQALPGRQQALSTAEIHFVTGNPLHPPFPAHLEQAVFGLGCFWGAERKFWQQVGVFSTAVGYADGHTPNPTYPEVCTGLTAHAEVVMVIYNPKFITYQQLLQLFWEVHNPTQGMRQGNDVGTQYRSVVLTLNDAQQTSAEQSKAHYQAQLSQAGYSQISTEIHPLQTFYYAEEEHQQYLAKNPDGYCGLGGLGVKFCH